MVTEAQPPAFLSLLAHDVRWQILALLAASDRRVHELVVSLKRPQNLVSYHLRLLRDARLVRERRSSADGRDIYYSLDLEYLRQQYRESGRALHPALSGAHRESLALHDGPGLRVLFLCTHNSARSQLAEGILRDYMAKRWPAFSAGSLPGQVHPLAVQIAHEMGIDIGRQRSKHLDEFAGEHFDAVITVCDRVREVCPEFPAGVFQAHWSIADPAAAAGAPEKQMQVFRATAAELSGRIKYLVPYLQEKLQARRP
jgi:protein-tyrosine-phosphatase